MLAASVVLTPAQAQAISSRMSECVRQRQAEAAVGLGDLEVHEAELERLVHDLGGKLALLVEVAGDGRDLLAGELARGLDEGVLLVGEREIEHAPP